SRKPVTEIRLRIPAGAPACPAVRAAHTRSRSRRPARPSRTSLAQDARVSPTRAQLTGDGSGRFRTRGRNSSATNAGNISVTTERCDGTLTGVRRGRVRVLDLRTRATVTVKAG